MARDGKEPDAIEIEASEKTHKNLRDLCKKYEKRLVLGVQYYLNIGKLDYPIP